MSDLVEVVGLGPILKSAGIEIAEPDLEAIYQDLSESPNHLVTITEIESRIRTYFESIEIPENATFYDYMLLSLREKDLVATFNWDPLLLQAYRRNAAVRRLPRVHFLHGNVSIGVCLDCRVVGPANCACENCGHELQPSRLLYPVQDKDYVSDPFIEGEWHALRRNLRQAYIVTIVGYSAPSADAAAVELMQEVWDQNQTRELAQIEIVNTQSKDELFETWEPFIVREHYHITDTIHRTLQARWPRRSCDAFASATLLLSPWPINQLPEFRDLFQLQSWIQPLLQEEIALEEDGVPLSGKTTEEIQGGAT